MSATNFRICRFDAVGDIPKKSKYDYETVKAAVLKAGRFSAFEASENDKTGALFTRLCRDPELEIDNESVGYPWVLVRKKTEIEKARA